jgi:hypothetical protein
MARDTPLLVAQGILRRLAARRVRVVTCHHAVALAGGTARMRHVLTGEEMAVEDVALLAYASARAPRDGLAAALRDAGVVVRVAGDALAPRLMLSAVREGQAAAEAI